MPEWLSFEDAASLPIAALTALNGLRRCGVGEGTRLLINGATGGVDHLPGILDQNQVRKEDDLIQHA